MTASLAIRRDEHRFAGSLPHTYANGYGAWHAETHDLRLARFAITREIDMRVRDYDPMLLAARIARCGVSARHESCEQADHHHMPYVVAIKRVAVMPWSLIVLPFADFYPALKAYDVADLRRKGTGRVLMLTRGEITHDSDD